MPDIKQRAHKLFDDFFSGALAVDDDTFQKVYQKLHLMPMIHKFIDEIIDIAVAERDKEIVEIVHKRIFELNEDIQPLQKEYDTAYKCWNNGIRSEQNKKICEEYESGSKGNRLFALSEKMEEAKDIINLISKPKLSAEALNIK